MISSFENGDIVDAGWTKFILIQDTDFSFRLGGKNGDLFCLYDDVFHGKEDVIGWLQKTKNKIIGNLSQNIIPPEIEEKQEDVSIWGFKK